jgi:hypothetical protein
MALRDKKDSALFQLVVKYGVFFEGQGRGIPVACDKIMKVGFIRAGYDAKFRNAGGHVPLNGILDDRFSPYRKEFLWGVIR